MPTRREVLARAAWAVAAVPLTGCAGAPPLPPGAVRVSLDTLPEGERVLVMREEEPVELVRTGSTIVARSLYCTHMGCRVAWDAGRQRYLCPCHGGEFDQAGRPVAGVPVAALEILPVALESGAVVVMRRVPRDAGAG